MQRVVIESPLAASEDTATEWRDEEQAQHVAYVQQCVLHSLQCGEAPYASHLFFSHVLDDNDPDERKLGIAAGFEWAKAGTLTAVYVDYGISPGTRAGIEEAKRKGRRVVYRTLTRPSAQWLDPINIPEGVVGAQCEPWPSREHKASADPERPRRQAQSTGELAAWVKAAVDGLEQVHILTDFTRANHIHVGIVPNTDDLIEQATAFVETVQPAGMTFSVGPKEMAMTKPHPAVSGRTMPTAHNQVCWQCHHTTVNAKWCPKCGTEMRAADWTPRKVVVSSLDPTAPGVDHAKRLEEGSHLSERNLDRQQGKLRGPPESGIVE